MDGERRRERDALRIVLRPLSRAAGVVAALWYACPSVPSTSTHPPAGAAATTVLLLAWWSPAARLGGGHRDRHYVVAGALLGLSPVLKIWGIVAVLVVVIAIWARRGRRRPGDLGSAAASCAAACLPFFLAAPRRCGRWWSLPGRASQGQ